MSRNEHSFSPGAPTQKLQKVLAQAGHGSRREIEDWIRAGRVMVNGVAAQVGARVGAHDAIQVDGRPVGARQRGPAVRVLLYHKPEGEIVSRDDPEGRASVFDRLPRVKAGKWLAVGRLDFNTGGLLILTTSGELANRMMHPRYEHEREYAVRIRGRISPADMERFTRGVQLADGPAKLESMEDQGGEGTNHWYRIVVQEGRNRIVRRLFEAMGLTVSRLMRTRFGPVELPPRLTRGNYLELSQTEVQQLFAAVGAPQTQEPDSHRQDSAPERGAEDRRNRGGRAPLAGVRPQRREPGRGAPPARSARSGTPVRLGGRSKVREQRAAAESGSAGDAAALHSVPHHRSGNRGRGAPTPEGAGTASPSAGQPAGNSRNRQQKRRRHNYGR